MDCLAPAASVAAADADALPDAADGAKRARLASPRRASSPVGALASEPAPARELAAALERRILESALATAWDAKLRLICRTADYREGFVPKLVVLSKPCFTIDDDALNLESVPLAPQHRATVEGFKAFHRAKGVDNVAFRHPRELLRKPIYVLDYEAPRVRGVAPPRTCLTADGYEFQVHSVATDEFLLANPGINSCVTSPFRNVSWAIRCEDYEEEEGMDPDVAWWFVHPQFPDEEYDQGESAVSSVINPRNLNDLDECHAAEVAKLKAESREVSREMDSCRQQ